MSTEWINGETQRHMMGPSTPYDEKGNSILMDGLLCQRIARKQSPTPIFTKLVEEIKLILVYIFLFFIFRFRNSILFCKIVLVQKLLRKKRVFLIKIAQF